jgi:acyl-homoserine lactone acylase PvdQ
MQRNLLWCGVAVATLLACACSSDSPSPTDGGMDAFNDARGDAPKGDGPGDAAVADAGDPNSVEIVRDDRGVPHVYGKSLRAAFYGLGYATAQDRLFQMHFQRSTVRGQLAELFAYEEKAPDLAAKQQFNAGLIKSDTTQRTIGYARHAERIWSNLPGDIPALLQAYTDGINAWIADPAFKLPPAFAKVGLTKMPPWRPADCLLVWDRISHLFGGPQMQIEIDNLNACIAGSCPQPPCKRTVDEDAAVVQKPKDGKWPPVGSDATPPLPLPRPGDQLPWGGKQLHKPVDVKASHSWAVHGSCTTTGKPVLALDPKLALVAPNYWYQFHLSAPGVDVRGVSFAGAPGVAIYWNRYTSHTLTAGGGDIADLFELKPGSKPNTYLLDGAEKQLAVFNEQLKVRGGSPVKLKLSESAFGPVVNGLLKNVPAGRVYALRHAELMRAKSHSIVAAIELMRSTSLKTYRAALAHWVGPTTNAIYAGVDKDAPANDTGHIAYHALLHIPKRQPIKRGGFDFTGQLPYDGSSSKNDWDGVYGLSWNPHVIDPASCHLFSGNHLPVGQWHHDLVYSGIRGVGDSYRSLILRYKLQDALAGGKKVSPAQVHALHLDATSKSVELYRAVLQKLSASGAITKPASLATAPTTPAEKAGRALEVLDLWQTGGALLSRTAPTAVFVGRLNGTMLSKSRYYQHPKFSCKWHESEGGVSRFLKAFDKDDKALTTIEQDWAIDVAKTAWDATMTASPTLGVDPSKWPAGAPLAHSAHNHQNFFCAHPTSQKDNCSLDPAAKLTLSIDRGYIHTVNSAQASSYPATVDYADIDAAKALLPPGQSEDPQSPYYKDAVDELEAISRGEDKFPAAPLSRGKITETSKVQLTYAPKP